MRFASVWADPPWFYNDQKKIRKDGAQPTRGIGACHHFEQMTIQDICDIDVASVTAERCHLHLWACCPLLPEALQVLVAWGFRWTTIEYTWIKCNGKRWEEIKREIMQTDFFEPTIDITQELLHRLTRVNPGFYSMSNVELVLLGTRGKPFRHAKGHKARQVQYATAKIVPDTNAVFAPLGEHSEKPDIFYELDQWAYPQCTPRLEMFGRKARKGYTVIGNEAPGHEGEDINVSIERIRNENHRT